MLGGILKTFVDGQKRMRLMDSEIDGIKIKGIILSSNEICNVLKCVSTKRIKQHW